MSNSQAGANAAANNWLATQQRARMIKELSAATPPLEQLKVVGKWTLVTIRQGALTASGVDRGLVDAGIDDIQGLADFMSNPLEAQKEYGITTEQALRLGESLAVLLPVYGTPIGLYEALSGESLLGRDLGVVERFFVGAAALVPTALRFTGRSRRQPLSLGRWPADWRSA
ncbi:hypothetical protein [Variovorax soli]|uniref:Uncharacterized protein n=1 Tax=Variovorax soli TaxID=376815 RepID=A0ABU1NP57_9BURK|nr:hypothetical protein [Variovorax soli]MDR6539790.1 hypothetical protein [Variovorax soli]